MSPSKQIKPDEECYEEIHRDWVANGRTPTFDREGNFGGCRYRVLDIEAGRPDFYQVASLGPTTFRNDAVLPHCKQGWAFLNEQYSKLRFAERDDGSWQIDMIETPNELDPSETIAEPKIADRQDKEDSLW